MDEIRLVLDPFQNMNKIYLNDNPISRFSRLYQMVHAPVLEWAMDFFREAEDEMNGEFKLVVCGSRFETHLFETISKKYECCAGYRTERYQIDAPLIERWDKAVKIVEKYGIDAGTCISPVPVYTDMEDFLSPFITVSSEETACLVYLRSGRNTSEQIERAVLTITMAEEDFFEETGKGRYIWGHTDKTIADSCFSETIEYLAMIPSLCTLSKKLTDLQDVMSIEDKYESCALLMIEAAVTVQEIPELLVDTSYRPTVSTVPSGFPIPEIRMESSHDGIIHIREAELSAVGEGTAEVRFYKKDETLPFYKAEVHAYRDNIVKQIRLTAQKTILGIGQTEQITVEVIPPNADDRDECRWSVDKKEILEIAEDGRLTALTVGTALVSYSSPKVSASVTIEVLPEIEEIILSEPEIHMYVGETRSFDITFSPERVYDDDIFCVSSDNDVASYNDDDDTEENVIRANSVGECTLEFMSSSGKASTKLLVTVESTFSKRGADFTVDAGVDVNLSEYLGKAKQIIGNKVKEFSATVEEKNMQAASEREKTVRNTASDDPEELGTREKAARIAGAVDEKAKMIFGDGLIYQSAKSGGNNIKKLGIFAKACIDQQVKKAVDKTYDGIFNKKKDSDKTGGE